MISAPPNIVVTILREHGTGGSVLLPNSDITTGAITSTCSMLSKYCKNVMAWHGMAWYGMPWHGMAWYGMAWCGMEQRPTVGKLVGWNKVNKDMVWKLD